MLLSWQCWPCSAYMMAKEMTLYYLNHSTYGDLQLQAVLVNSRCLAGSPGPQAQVRQKGKRVRYVVERMTMSDVPRVIEIERLAYPSTWPPSAYRKELQDNRWAHYIVLRDKKIAEERVAVPVPQEPEKQRRFFPLSLLPSRSTTTAQSPSLASIIG